MTNIDNYGLPADRFVGRIADHEDRIAVLERLLSQSRSLVRCNMLDNATGRINQRGNQTGLTATLSSGYASADRWRFTLAGAGTWAHASTDTVVPGAGLVRCVRLTPTTAKPALAASDRVLHYQSIDRNTLNAFQAVADSTVLKHLYLTFWVYPGIAGTYILEIQQLNGASNRNISIPYTVVANQWQKIAIPIPTDMAANIGLDTNRALDAIWWIAAGTDWTAGAALNSSWTSAPASNTRAVGQVNGAATINAAWHMTMAQLEVGTQATPFELLPYEDDLRRCYMFYRRLNNYADNSGGARMLGTGQAGSTTVGVFFIPLNVSMRRAPHTIDVSAQSHFDIWQGGSAYPTIGISANLDGASPDGIRVEGSIATASLSTWGGVIFRSRAGFTSWLGISADL